jgi:hypothetical protein
VIELRIPFGTEIDLPEMPNGYITHRIESTGLWSIWAEHDEDPYFDEVFKDQRAELVFMLTTMGIEVEDDSPQDGGEL